ncbi:MAG TPA: efflux RND transporter periplasmic adaptor subunit, partial [Isosphaeraceae bacterium]|nr:efflux RND transporter periplasmic adaptor subunit [Isosphaeraceae bacterium]
RALNQVTIRARVKGFLKEVHFTEGSNVKKGDLLLVIEEEPFKVKVAQAKAVLEEAEAALKRAKESRAREVAKARVSLDETQLQLDRVEERRERNLVARKAASQEDYDQAKAKVDKSAAQVEADSASLQQAVADYDINILSAQAKIDQARADLEAAELDLGYCRMFSPIDGRIGELQVKLGNLVGPATSMDNTTSLVSIQQLDPMGVDLRPPSRYLPVITRLVKKGLEVKLKIGGLKAHPHTGKVTFVDNNVETTTSTVLVKAEVPNPDQAILPGEYVKVEVNIGEYAGGIVIPDAAVVEAQEGSRVLLVDDQNKVEVAVVKPLDVYQGLVVIESGLNEGRKVIVKGIQLVRPGQTVKTEEAELEKFVRPYSESEVPDPLDSPLMRIRGAAESEPNTPPSNKPVVAQPARGSAPAPAPPEKTSGPAANPTTAVPAKGSS